MPKSSIQIQNEIVALNGAIAEQSVAFNAANGDEQAAIHDAIVRDQAKRELLTEQLTDQLKAEDEIRNGGGVPKAAARPATARVNPVAAFLGTREEFDARGGIENIIGKKVNVTKFSNAADTTHQLGLATPSKVSYDLPENIIEMPMGVIDTLAKGTTDSSLTYMAQGAFTNNAALWKPGEVKAESDESWTSDTATLFTVAHYIPVSKHTAKHYGQLQSLIGNDLMTGLKIKEAGFALNLDASAGQKGILKKDVQEFTAKKGEKFYSTVRRMMTASWMATGMRPDHVAVHPLVLEQLDLEQLTDGQYMNLVINNRIWSLPIVEDVNLVSGETGSETYGALVYAGNAATWYTSETDGLILGFVNDQFVRNEFTLLAEGEHLITVTRPKSFVHLADAINPGK